MNVLGIETSCDETALAVVADGRRILSNVVSSQVKLHARYGGVVPELASREHVQAMVPVLDEALRAASAGLDDIDAIAVTHGPGLAGALLVGLNFAKALAFALSRPLIGVNHLEGHIYAAWLERTEEPEFPALALIVSGGHSDIVLMDGHGQYRRLGETVDDAAGEAFDKVARLLGLGYPGGPAIDRVATTGDPGAVPFPRAMAGEPDFSFAGLKTAVAHHLRRHPRRGGRGASGGVACRVVPGVGGRFPCDKGGASGQQLRRLRRHPRRRRRRQLHASG